MSKRFFASFLVCIIGMICLAGCSRNTASTETSPNPPVINETEHDTTKGHDVPGTEDNTTPEETTPEPSTPEESSSEIATTEEETTTKQEYVGAWTLMSTEPLNPSKSGYEELDRLIDELLSRIVTADMNGYKKAWACYEYLVDNITYSRGMDANTGMYSESDPAVTPKEVLWATDLLNTGMGCCYHYSSTYVYLLRAIGFDAHLVSGNVPKYGGGVTPHCWLYVNLGGEQYIFDPDLDMNYYTRDKGNGVENPAKDRFFCVRADKMSYFYKAETYHTN